MITNVNFVSIPTRDQERALAFWVDRIGCKVQTDQPMGDQRWIELSFGHSQTRIVLFLQKGQEDRVGTFWGGAFGCDDVEATYRQLSARGVEFTQVPQNKPWGTLAIFKDPEGNEFVLGERV